MYRVILKKGKEKILFSRHHWIFSGAILEIPKDYQDGDIAAIYSEGGVCLGHGFFKRGQSLSGRVLSFGSEDVFISLKKTLDAACALRERLIDTSQTNAYRLVNGEGDEIPSLIIDRYGPYLVLQASTLGMRKLVPWFVEELKKRFVLKGIYEKSTGASLKEEGIDQKEEVIFGEIPDEVEILEANIRFLVDIKKGQKTGFFLDQRQMRKWVFEFARGGVVLNAFCYTGGFTVSALKGGAKRVDSVDVSKQAMDFCRTHVSLNGFDENAHGFFQKDVFEFLENSPLNYDLVILDPPAFAKKKSDVPKACQGYKRLLLLALQKMPKNSLLLVSSCSYHVSEELFQELILASALRVNRSVKILGRHRLAVDHPINLFHPESSYLKSFLLAL